MKLYSAILCNVLAQTFLIAQAPAQNPQALVVKYAELVKNYPQMLKDDQQRKARIPIQDTVTGISVRIAHEASPEIRQVLMMARHFMVDAMAPDPSKLSVEASNYTSTIGTAWGLELAGQIPPDSPALELVALHQPTYLSFIAWHASGGGFVNQSESIAAANAFAFFDKVFETHPSRAVKGLALASAMELASRPRMIAQVEGYLARLEAFEPSHPAVAQYKKWLVQAREDDKSAPRVGNSVPAFKLQNLDKPSETITPATFKGKYLLLDFWATWCGPCKAELPFVHKAYAKFHPAGLEMLSISWDKKSEDILKFRKDPAHPMPWRHAFPQGKVAEELNRKFQVRGIPHVLLISPEGKILETAENLRGEKLEETLGKYMKPKS